MHSPLRHWPAALWKRRPIQLTFFLTRRCNARCPYCFYLGGDHRRGDAAAELDVGEIERLSRSLSDLLWLAFSGGEVFLRRDLVEISGIFYRNNRPAIMLYPTNGMMPAHIAEQVEQILQRCPDSTIVVKLSVDGLYEEHDRLRDTPGSFQRTLETHAALTPLLSRYRNFELGVNTVFMSGNQDRMDEIIDFVGGLPGVRAHTISLIRGTPAVEDLQAVDLGKYHRAVSRLARDLARGGATYRFQGGRLKAAQDVLQRRLIYQTMTARQRLTACYAGRANLVLAENGDVYPCEIRAESFGNVRDYGYDLAAVCRSSRAQRALTSIRDRECHCSHECYFMTNIFLNPRLYPALFAEYRRLSAG